MERYVADQRRVAGPVTYDFRLVLRAIYQHLCSYLPLATEPAYSLAIGLPADSKLTNAELATRADECLGVRKLAAQRTPQQAQKLKTIVDVLKILESSVVGHLNWSTYKLRDVVAKNGGVSPFGNERVRYVGSADDAALNDAAPRFKPDLAAVARLAFDVDHAGRFSMPVVSAHGIGNATVFVKSSDTLRQRMAAAGNGHWLMQNFVDSTEHSNWGDAYYPPLLNALLNWVEKGQKPKPAGLAASCVQQPGAAAKDCQFLPDYVNKPSASRIFVR